MSSADLNDKDISARLRDIVARRRQGDEQRYGSELTELYRLAPHHPRVSRRYVRHLIDAGELEQARAIGTAIYETAPNAYLAWDLVDLSSRSGDDDMLSRFLKEFHHYVGAGFSDFNEDRYKTILAEAWHLDVVDLNGGKAHPVVSEEPDVEEEVPTEAELRRRAADQRRLANQLARDGRHDELLAMVEASSHARNDPAMRLLTSAARYAAGQEQEAMDDLSFVIANGDPKLVSRARARRANFLRNMGRNAEALSEYKILRKTPAAADLGFERAMYRTLRAIGLGATVDRYVRAAARAYERSEMEELRYMQLLFNTDRQFDLIALGPRLYATQPQALELCFRALLEVGRHYSAWQILEQFEDQRASLSSFVTASDRAIMDLCDQGLVQSDDAILDFGISLLKALKALRQSDGIKQHSIMLSASSLGIGGCERQLLTLSKYAHEHVPDASLFAYVWLPKATGYRIKHDLRVLAKEDAADLEPIRWSASHVTVNGKRFSVEEALGLTTAILRITNIDDFLRLVQHERPELIHYTVGSIVDFIVATYLSGASRILLQFGSRYLGDQASGSDIFNNVIATSNKLIACAKDDDRYRFAINSKAAAESWVKWTELDVDDLDVIYNGVDETFLRDVSGSDVSKMRSRLGLQPADLIVGGVFRMHTIKDPFLWVRTVEHVLQDHPHAVGVLVGDGALGHRVAAMIERSPMRGRITMYGEAHDELPVLYRCMDALLVTSRSESLPNTVLEAQAQGTPVVSVNVGGVAEAVALGTIVDSRDSRELARTVIETLKSRKPRTARIRKCRKHLRDQFGADVMVRKTFHCYGII